MKIKKKTKNKSKEPTTICICGMAGSGKSTAAKSLAQKYDLRYFSGGDALKALAMEEGYKNVEYGWWESEEGMRFLKRRRKDQTLDEEMDKKLLELAQQGKVILDSWTMPWLLKKGFKIWLEASPEERARRIAKRDHISNDEALKALISKEAHTRDIYQKLYGFNLGEDYSPFHLILDTENINAEEVLQILSSVIDNCLLHLRRTEKSSISDRRKA